MLEKNSQKSSTILSTHKLELEAFISSQISAQESSPKISIQASIVIPPRKRAFIESVPETERYLFKELSQIKYQPS